MQAFINLLIDTLREAHTRRPAPRYLELSGDLEGMEDIIDMEMGLEEEEQTMETIFGVPQKFFPPADKLTDEQLQEMVDEILNLWRVYHYEAELPEGLPVRLAYPLLIKSWKETHPLFRGSNGYWHVEFCRYEPDECPFPSEFCRCKGLKDENTENLTK